MPSLSTCLDAAPAVQSYIGKGAALSAQAPPGHASLASDPQGAFSLRYTFERDMAVGDKLALRCWMDAESVARGHFTVTLGKREAPGRQRYGEGDQPLPCITSYCRAAPGPCSGKLPVRFALVTAPTTFLAGDRLVVTITLACEKGCENIMRGQLYYGADLPSGLAFDATPLPGSA
ncbi:hypothetical protein [Massilia sp. S19_KUP03_FR1]|uniref:hypothetical protein n=1 Tax=Massilia sp. S19_KUP03_FR1 TaxID=3025503 RepID=UPI002FCD9AA9